MLAPRTVLATHDDIRQFANSFPCSGMRFDDCRCVSFEFDSTGSLVDIAWYDEDGLDIQEPDSVDGYALMCLSQDAQKILS